MNMRVAVGVCQSQKRHPNGWTPNSGSHRRSCRSSSTAAARCPPFRVSVPGSVPALHQAQHSRRARLLPYPPTPRSGLSPAAAFLASLLLATWFCASAAPIETPQNVMAEITFAAQKEVADPFNAVALDVIFDDPRGKIFRMPAFWAGGRTWKARYSSSTLGVHRYHTECTSGTDPGLNGLTGEVKVVRYRGHSPLFEHGPVRVAPDHRHFEYADGTPFFWLGDTWWMGLCQRIHWPNEFETLTQDRKAKGFNVVQIVAGLYPDMPPFDPRGANEAGYPWETNYSRIRPEYFDAADRRLIYLTEQGITPCLVGAWGYFMPWMGVEKAKQHWRYLIARYAACPVIWCAAGEVNLPYYLVKGFPFDSREQVKDWSEVMRYIRETDPFHRPLSVHPTGMGRLSARGTVADQALLDFDMLQTGHGLREILPQTVKAMRDSYADRPTMPVLNSEVCFEQLGGNIPADIPRLMFWASILCGGAGHTYGANGIWQCNRPGQPHGNSPGGANWGDIPWNEAMKLPGSAQVGWGKQFLESFGWSRFTPQSDSVAWVEQRLPEHWGDWIWFPEGDPTTGAPTERRFFRRTFELPEKGRVKRARLLVSADNRFDAWINGQRIGSGMDWHSPVKFEVAGWLQPGTNVMAIRAENLAPPDTGNPAGMIASLEVEFEAGQNFTLLTDGTWRCAKSSSSGWTKLDWDESGWVTATVLAPYGKGPWGKIGGAESAVVPFAAGVGDRVRVIYAPDPQSVRVSHLRPRAKYRVTRLDPVTGKRSEDTTLTADATGSLELPPARAGMDWAAALVLR
jgi:hypothetical protein